VRVCVCACVQVLARYGFIDYDPNTACYSLQEPLLIDYLYTSIPFRQVHTPLMNTNGLPVQTRSPTAAEIAATHPPTPHPPTPTFTGAYWRESKMPGETDPPPLPPVNAFCSGRRCTASRPSGSWSTRRPT
jgi:hypothetical protein